MGTIALSPCAILGNMQFWGTCNWGELAIGGLAVMLGLATMLGLAVTLGLAPVLGLAGMLGLAAKIAQKRGTCNFGELTILGNLHFWVKLKKKKWGNLQFWGT